MAIYQQLGSRAYDVSEVFSAPPDLESEVLCTYSDGDDQIVAKSNTFTIVMNRDILKSVEIANEMAVYLARKYPERRVLLVNTYAGTELMQRTLAVAMARNGSKLPPSFARHLPEMWKDSIGGEDTPSPVPVNLRVLDCESGMFEAWRLEEECMVFGASIVLLNSFEFAAIDIPLRREIATELLDIRQRHSLTAVIFSHEMRGDISIFTPGRGALGILSAFAGSVWRLMSQADRARYIAHYRRVGSLTNPKARVHENQDEY